MTKAKVGGVAVDQLKSIIARVEMLTEERDGIAADIRDVFSEAAGAGFDVKAIRSILKLRKQDASEREEAETILDTYLHALGMQPDLFDCEDDQEAALPLASAKDDDMYLQAVAIVVRDRKASSSYLQRVLKIGYNRAAELVEQMEREGVVGPANHVGKREVLRPEGGVA